MVITTSIDYDKQRIADGWMRGHVDTQLSFFLVTTTYMMVWNGFLNVPFTHRHNEITHSNCIHLFTMTCA
jgi:hypothetical protein